MGRYFPLVCLIAVALVAAGALTASGRADGTCDVGYTLTSGGVTQADVNDDGLTCEVTTVDGDTITTIALDNTASTPAAGPGTCPDDFLLTPWVPNFDPDRNGNGFVCTGKQFKSGRDGHITVHAIRTDDRT